MPRQVSESAAQALFLITILALALFALPELRALAPTDGAQPNAVRYLPAGALSEASAACRVASWEVQADGPTLWIPLQNTGQQAVILQAVELGWRGSARLEGLLLEAEGQSSIYSGRLTSPAVVVPEATGRIELRPGQTVRLGAVFSQPVAASDLSPALMHFDNDCHTAAPPPKGSCRTSAFDLQVVGSGLTFQVTNGSGSRDSLAALELDWPAENGPLVAVLVGGSQVWADATGATLSPARVDLTAGRKLPLGPGQTQVVQLLFGRLAQSDPYVLSALTASECRATVTTWSGWAACPVQTTGLEVRGDSARLGLYNSRPATATLESVTLYWPEEAGRALTGISLEGRALWSGRLEESPAQVQLEGDIGLAIAPRAQTGLVFSFASPASSAAEHYSVIVGFRDGCQAVYTTRKSPACGLVAGLLSVSEPDRAAILPLSNSGAPARVSGVVLSWPEANGALREIWLGAQQVWQGQAATSPYTITLSSESPLLESGARSELRLTFASAVAQQPYSASLDVEAGGQACPSILVTTRQPNAQCQVALAGQPPEGFVVSASLSNQADTELELATIELDWEPGTGGQAVGLTRVAVDGREMWSGPPRKESPFVAHSPGSMTIGAGQSKRLTFHFDSPFDDDSPFNITVRMVEGCAASWSQGDRRTSTRHVIRGQVEYVPNGIYGLWQVAGQRIRVLATTVISPHGIVPRKGDLANIDALRPKGDLPVAISVDIERARPLVHLSGVVERVDWTDPPRWLELDDAMIRILPGVTAIEPPRSLQPGVYASLDARRVADGTLEALHISVTADATRSQQVRFEGTLQRVEGSGQIRQRWWVNEVPVIVDASTVIRPELRYREAPAPGRRVSVLGLQVVDGVVGIDLYVYPPDDSILLRGTLLDLPGGDGLGLWRIEAHDGQTYEVWVHGNTIIDTAAAPAVGGAAVEIMASREAGALVAQRVRTEWAGAAK